MGEESPIAKPENNKSTYILYVAIAVVSLLLGYLLGNYVPFRAASTPNTGNQTSNQNTDNVTTNIPSGKGLLEITVTDSSGKPMVGIETDVALQPGPPEAWGTKEADTNGKTSFELAPGSYYVYFNMNRFPSGYVVPSEQKVTVLEGQTNKVTIVLAKS